MIKIEDIRRAKAQIQGVAIETPLLPYSPIDSNRQLYFKPENLQPIGAFKLRGAYNKISSLSDGEKEAGVIAHSSGNHAQGVAYSAKKLGIKVTIVMPQAAPSVKIQNTRNLGAEVILVEDGAEKQMEVVTAELSAKNGHTIIPPYDDDLIIAGQGTVGLEIFNQCPDVSTVFSPIGGGGLIGGTAAYLKTVKPDIRIIGVEPEVANDTQQSFVHGGIQSISKEQAKSTIADGLRVTQPGELTFPLVQRYVDDVITVSESQIVDATRKIISDTRLLVEPSGAVSFAAWIDNPGMISGDGAAVCIISGGNIDPVFFSSLFSA